MTATKIDGTAIAKKIRERLHAEIESTQKINPRYKPSLKIIQGTISIPIKGLKVLTSDSQWAIDQTPVCRHKESYIQFSRLTMSSNLR